MITNIVSIQNNIQTMLDIIKLIARQIKKTNCYWNSKKCLANYSGSKCIFKVYKRNFFTFTCYLLVSSTLLIVFVVTLIYIIKKCNHSIDVHIINFL